LKIKTIIGDCPHLFPKEFAEGATGEVHVFLDTPISPSSIWLNEELPTLIKNPNVTNIVHHSVP
jgi:hypothetical protein